MLFCLPMLIMQKIITIFDVIIYWLRYSEPRCFSLSGDGCLCGPHLMNVECKLVLPVSDFLIYLQADGICIYTLIPIKWCNPVARNTLFCCDVIGTYYLYLLPIQRSKPFVPLYTPVRESPKCPSPLADLFTWKNGPIKMWQAMKHETLIDFDDELLQ